MAFTELVWLEEHANIGAAFAREEQVQDWSRAKRLALLGSLRDLLDHRTGDQLDP